MTNRKKGGRQIKSRRELIRQVIGKKVRLIVKNEDWQESGFPINLRGTLEFRDDKGYFLKGTNAQIYLPYISRHSRNGRVIEIDLSRSLVQSPHRYQEATRI